jgi:hypothetical protein
MLKQIILGVALVAMITVTWGSPRPVMAQGRCAGAERGIELALQKIEAARRSMDGCSAPEAGRLMETAMRNLRQAQDEARGGGCRRAEVQARAAIAIADRAIELCREGDRHRELLERTMENTEDQLGDCLDRVKSSGDPHCEQLVRAAVEHQRKARGEFRADRLRVALQLTLRSRELCEQSMRCSEDGRDTALESVEIALQRTDRFLEEARRLLEDAESDKTSLGQLADAARLQDQAWRTFRGSRLPLALRLTRQARELGARALDGMRADLSVEDVQRMIEGTEDLLQTLDEAAAEAGDDVANTLLKRAHGQLEEASRELRAGRVREALGRVRASSSLALDAATRLGVGEDE